MAQHETKVEPKPAAAAPASSAEEAAAEAGGTSAAAGGRVEIRVEAPPADAVRVVVVPAGALVHLDAPVFHPDVARYVVDGDDLVVVLRNGAILRLDGFFAHPEMPPALSVLGGPPVGAADLLSGVHEGAQVAPAAGAEVAPMVHGGGAGFAPFEPGDIGEGFAKAGPLASAAPPEMLTGGQVTGLPEAGEPPTLHVTGETVATLGVIGFAFTPRAAGPVPVLTPGSPPWPPTAVGSTGHHPVMDAPRDVTVTFRSESAALHDSLGVYTVAPDGTVDDVRILFPDVNGSHFDPTAPWIWDGRGPLVEWVSQQSFGPVPAGFELGFFIVSDGAHLNPELAGWAGVGTFELRDARTGDPLDVTDPAAVPQLVHIAPDGTEHVVNTGNRLFVSHDPTPDTPFENPLNPDGAAHVVMGYDPLRSELVVGFEDVDTDGTIGGGLFHFDGDYDDVVVGVGFGPREGLVVHYGSDVTGIFDVTVADPDSARLSGARIWLGADAQPGDFLYLAGVADADGDGIIDGTAISYTFVAPDELRLSGVDDIARYEQVLEAVRLGVDPASGHAGTRTVFFEARDAEGHTSPPASATILVEDHLLTGTDGDDLLAATAVPSAVFGAGGDDFLIGGPGDDLLYGGEGRDRLFGDPGDDILIGGPGNDHLFGGPGADRFVVTGLGDGYDAVRDFDAAEGDVLDLSELFRGTGFPGPSAPDAGDWLRTRPWDWDGDGRDDVRVEVDLDGAGGHYTFVPVLAVLDTTVIPPSALVTDLHATVV